MNISSFSVPFFSFARPGFRAHFAIFVICQTCTGGRQNKINRPHLYFSAWSKYIGSWIFQTQLHFRERHSYFKLSLCMAIHTQIFRLICLTVHSAKNFLEKNMVFRRWFLKKEWKNYFANKNEPRNFFPTVLCWHKSR